MYIHLNGWKQMTYLKLLLLHSNTWNYLNFCNNWLIVNRSIRIEYWKPFNFVPKKKKKKKMSSNTIKNVKNKMSLQIVYLIYIYMYIYIYIYIYIYREREREWERERLALNNLQWLICRKTNQIKTCLAYMYKEDLAFNNLQWLICHKLQTNQIVCI